MTNYYDYSAADKQELRPRRLPPVPRAACTKSRPLPQIPWPRALACKECNTCITSSRSILPPSAIPGDSRSFRGFSGKASLFTETYNVRLSRPGVHLMATGAHTMQEIFCSSCSTYLGWKIIRAHEQSEKWKEGNCLLELEKLHYDPSPIPLYVRPRSRTSMDSDSEYSP